MNTREIVENFDSQKYLLMIRALSNNLDQNLNPATFACVMMEAWSLRRTMTSDVVDLETIRDAIQAMIDICNSNG